uniref:Uncharacterized protein n=1 Tax=Arundo donax TaxID=35708 RepID=A0A0A9GFV3_ARUDO
MAPASTSGASSLASPCPLSPAAYSSLVTSTWPCFVSGR